MSRRTGRRWFTSMLAGCMAAFATLLPTYALGATDPPNTEPANGGGTDPVDEAEPAPAADDPPHFEPVDSRWFAPGNPVVLRDGTPLDIPPYEINERAAWWNSYRQHKLKGDFPIMGDDLFMNMTVTSRSIVGPSKAPTRTGITGPFQSVRPEFWGRSDRGFGNQDLAFTFDFFKGQQAFKPVDWRLKISPVVNYTDLALEEVGGVKINVGDGRTRQEDDFALQEMLFEYHLGDLSDRYDFHSAEIGIFPFRSDFRGFVFDDVNFGVRAFGNLDNNFWQYNLVLFDMLDKDTNSLLNKFDDREQEVFIANIYRQDWPWRGYTTSMSFHMNHDDRGVHFDDNDLLVTPAPVGNFQENEITSYYLGWAGEGHIDRLNVTHALYQVLGEEKNNPFAARDVDINAHLAAVEVSYDIDWWRLRAYGLLTSGDKDARDGNGEGFDGILDAPNFAGGPFSYFNAQIIGLVNTNLSNFQSFYPDLQTNKFEGQSNSVNPGLILLGGAIDVEVTPTTRAQLGYNYLRFSETDVLETYLELPSVDPEIGNEIYFGMQWRPWLTNNVIFIFGLSALDPGEGWARIYESDETVYQAFFNSTVTW